MLYTVHQKSAHPSFKSCWFNSVVNDFIDRADRADVNVLTAIRWCDCFVFLPIRTRCMNRVSTRMNCQRGHLEFQRENLEF